MIKRNVNSRITAALFVALLAFLFMFMPVCAATNGTGDFTGEMGSAVKAWTNFGSKHGPAQDESGYYISVYCCDVLGEAGCNGALFTDRLSIYPFFSTYVTKFEDTLLGDDAVVYPGLKSWLRGQVSGEDILKMFTEEIGLDTVLSWGASSEEIRDFLYNDIGTFYLDTERTKSVDAYNVYELEDHVNWYINVQPYAVFRGLGYSGSTPTYYEWAAVTASEAYNNQVYGKYNFLSTTCNNKIAQGYTDFYISETGSPDNYSYKTSPTAGYKQISAHTYGEAVQSIVFSELPNSLYYTESWFGDEYLTKSATAYWSLDELLTYGGRGWYSFTSPDLETSDVTLVSGNAVSTVSLNSTEKEQVTEVFIESGDGEDGFGDFSYDATLGKGSYVTVIKDGAYYAYEIVYYTIGDDNTFRGFFLTNASGKSAFPVVFTSGTYKFFDSANAATPFCEQYCTPGDATWVGWYDEHGDLFSSSKSGDSYVPADGITLTAVAEYTDCITVGGPLRVNDSIMMTRGGSKVSSTVNLAPEITPKTSLLTTSFSYDGMPKNTESNWNPYNSSYISTFGQTGFSAAGSYSIGFKAKGGYNSAYHTASGLSANITIETLSGSGWTAQIISGYDLCTITTSGSSGGTLCVTANNAGNQGTVQIRITTADISGYNRVSEDIYVSVCFDYKSVSYNWSIAPPSDTLPNPSLPEYEYQQSNYTDSQTEYSTDRKTVSISVTKGSGIASVSPLSATNTLTRNGSRRNERSATTYSRRSISYTNVRWYADEAHTILLGTPGDAYDSSAYPQIYPAYSVSYGSWEFYRTDYGPWYYGDYTYGSWSVGTVNLSAVCEEGYEFSYWETVSGDSVSGAASASTTLNLTTDTVLIAHAVRKGISNTVTVQDDAELNPEVTAQTTISSAVLYYTGADVGGVSNWKNYHSSYITVSGQMTAANYGTYSTVFTPKNGYLYPYSTAANTVGYIPVSTLNGDGWTAEIKSGSNLVSINTAGLSGGYLIVTAKSAGLEGTAEIEITSNSSEGYSSAKKTVEVNVSFTYVPATVSWSIIKPWGTLAVPELPAYVSKTETDTEYDYPTDTDSKTISLTLQKDEGVSYVTINGENRNSLVCTVTRTGYATIERMVSYNYVRTAAYKNIVWYAENIDTGETERVGCPGDSYDTDKYYADSFYCEYELDESKCGAWTFDSSDYGGWSEPEYTYGAYSVHTDTIAAFTKNGYMFAGWEIVNANGDIPLNQLAASTSVVHTKNTVLKAITSAFEFEVESVRISDSTVYAGGTLTVTATLNSYSTFAYTNVEVEVFYEGETKVLAKTKLSFGAYETGKQVTFTIPAGDTVGNRNIVVCVNNDSKEGEIDQDNNSMSVPVNIIWDFSLKNLKTDKTQYNAGDGCILSFDITNKNPYKAYTNVPVDIYLGGALADRIYVSMSAGQTMTVTYTLASVGTNYGNNYIIVLLNPDSYTTENVTTDNNATAGILVGVDLGITPVTPNSGYKAGTTVVTSFRVSNYSKAVRILPSDSVKIVFTVQIEDCEDIVRTWDSYCLPADATADNAGLVYFKWTVPEEAEGKEIDISARLDIPSAIPDLDTANNECVISSAGGSTVYIAQSDAQAEDPDFEDKKPDGFAETPAPASVTPYASWWMWEYNQSSDSFAKVVYGISLSQTTAEIAPDENCKSAEKTGNVWSIRSGYGISIIVTSPVCSNPGLNVPNSSAYAAVQTVEAFFPEFGFGDGEGEYSALDRTDIDGDGKKEFVFALNVNADDPENDRLHFLPVWFPDGNQNYKVSVKTGDCWCPQMTSDNSGGYTGGMISSVGQSNAITVSGSIYDDWYIGH